MAFLWLATKQSPHVRGVLKLGLNAFAVLISDSNTMVFQGKTRFPNGLSRALPCIIVGMHALLLHPELCFLLVSCFTNGNLLFLNQLRWPTLIALALPKSS